VEEEVTPEVADLLAREGFPNARLYKGAGCKKCHNTGHRGRLGLYELLEITPEVRALVNRAAPEEEIRQVAMTQGYRPLYYDGLLKVAEGRVTLDEVQRVCKTI
jgi:type II secretory ATPase GspE/PulE/Tfp pilus assembly ATPase PilB-like protein